MIESFDFDIKYGSLVESFDNGCLVIASTPDGYEIAITTKGQGFPIRTLKDETGKPWQASCRKDAEDRANKIVSHILCEYGTILPAHIAV